MMSLVVHLYTDLPYTGYTPVHGLALTIWLYADHVITIVSGPPLPPLQAESW
jgi:hypothetical protein